jgi:riboflavin synthase
MFTGIVEDCGSVRRVKMSSHGSTIEISSEKVVDDTRDGDSIAVNGVCLTVTPLGSDAFIADVSPQTLRTSNLRSLKAGDRVNLERSLRASDRFGGHFVLGHVDQVGKVVERRVQGNSEVFKIYAPEEVAVYLVPKGSIAVDGVSLTIAETYGDLFLVSVIPQTLQATTLRNATVGAAVNLEVDMIAKYVKKLLGSNEKSSSTLDLLNKHGYLD